ncbi:MAG: hypothetical protein AAFW73_18890 [Bacteroidota bacterium]
MKSSIFYSLLALLFLGACAREELVPSPLTANTTLQALLLDEEANPASAAEGEKASTDKPKLLDCFTLVYPLSLTLPDGTVLSGGEVELWEAIKAWYEANPTVDAKPELNYPLQIAWPEKEAPQILNGAAELKTAKEYCVAKKSEAGKDQQDCFELVYPLTWTLPDGSEVSMNAAEDWSAIKAWYEAHPDTDAKPELNYPVQIAWPGKDALATLNGAAELEAAKKYCGAEKWDADQAGADCFKLIYPLIWTLPDGSEVLMDDAEDWTAIKAWYESHPPTDIQPELNYPVEIVWPDKDVFKVIESAAEMEAAKEECK